MNTKTFQYKNKSLMNLKKQQLTFGLRFSLDGGPSGSGKTYLYNTITMYFNGKEQLVLTYVTAGIATHLLINDRTVHSSFKFSLSIDEISTSNKKS